MDPLRKEEKFERKYKDEPKPEEFPQSGEFKQDVKEDTAEAYDKPEKAGRMAVPMGPMPAAFGKGEQQSTSGGPRLVSKEAKATGEAKKACFFKENELRDMRARWDKIQGTFVDQPRQAVEDADNLLGEAIKKLTETCAEERSSVIRQWNSGENISTEVLRQSLRRYRAFFDRLLAA